MSLWVWHAFRTSDSCAASVQRVAIRQRVRRKAQETLKASPQCRADSEVQCETAAGARGARRAGGSSTYCYFMHITTTMPTAGVEELRLTRSSVHPAPSVVANDPALTTSAAVGLLNPPPTALLPASQLAVTTCSCLGSGGEWHGLGREKPGRRAGRTWAGRRLLERQLNRSSTELACGNAVQLLGVVGDERPLCKRHRRGYDRTGRSAKRDEQCDHRDDEGRTRTLHPWSVQENLLPPTGLPVGESFGMERRLRPELKKPSRRPVDRLRIAQNRSRARQRSTNWIEAAVERTRRPWSYQRPEKRCQPAGNPASNVARLCLLSDPAALART